MRLSLPQLAETDERIRSHGLVMPVGCVSPNASSDAWDEEIFDHVFSKAALSAEER
jgi:hypothetical protein